MRNARKALWIVAGLGGAVAVYGIGRAAALTPGATGQTATCNTPTTPFCNAVMPPPPGWTGPVFRLSQDYPRRAPRDIQPWLRFDPRTQPQEYLTAALKYFYAGNVRANEDRSFDPALNRVRTWYHAPWQDFGLNGREFVHGLTRERTSEPGELHPNQRSFWHNYAVGFYNAPGGVALGRVWADHGRPDPRAAIMPEGTVAAKLLFTTASEAEVPFLRGAPQWTAFVYANPNVRRPPPGAPRSIMRLRLLQIDVAVKDARVANTTGWVFGTFVYAGGASRRPGSGWTNVKPVGLMWGNDPDHPGTGSLREAWINPAVHLPHLGWQGRLNGPVDNKNSSCLSCHGTAEYPAGEMLPPAGAQPSRWFQNYRSGQPFDPGRISTDYSLQISTGLANFEAAKALRDARSETVRRSIRARIHTQHSPPPRDGGKNH